MNSTLDDAYKLGCGRMLFEYGAISKLGQEALRYGRKAWVLGGYKALADVQEQVMASLESAGVEALPDPYGGACSEEKARQIADACRKHGCDMIIGVGGGRIMDLLKIAADISGLPAIAVPTISATCAAYTPLSVVYSPEGACLGTWYFRTEIACVLCDLAVLCRQDKRYLAAGILDAMAKHIEILHHQPQQAAPGQDILLARMLASQMFDELMQLGPGAIKALETQEKSLALERCIFHVIVTTGLISGIARGCYQSAIAHALYEVIRTKCTAESAAYLHGEIVGVCLLAQARYLGRDDLVNRLRAFMKAAGAPAALADVGVNKRQHDLAHQPQVLKYCINGHEDAQRLARILDEDDI